MQVATLTTMNAVRLFGKTAAGPRLQAAKSLRGVDSEEAARHFATGLPRPRHDCFALDWQDAEMAKGGGARGSQLPRLASRPGPRKRVNAEHHHHALIRPSSQMCPSGSKAVAKADQSLRIWLLTEFSHCTAEPGPATSKVLRIHRAGAGRGETRDRKS